MVHLRIKLVTFDTHTYTHIHTPISLNNFPFQLEDEKKRKPCMRDLT